MVWGGIQDPALQPIYEKVAAGARLSREDGGTLFESPDLLGVGRLAQMVKERLHGRKAYISIISISTTPTSASMAASSAPSGARPGNPGPMR